MKDQNLESLVAFHKALSDETRVRIVNLLMEGPCCVKDMVEALGIAQSRVSQHLNVLRHAGMVSVSRVGTSRRYSLEKGAFPPELFDCIRRARDGSLTLLRDLERVRALIRD
ncbi:MAG: metalloregulator ArsR/SmtB family transcription factor [candidate division WOR-3 bacterium]